jgi:hypothetical protein
MLELGSFAVAVSWLPLGVASMPWAEVLLGLLALYLLVKGVQAVRDFVIWYQEGRAFAAEQKRVKDLRRQQRSAGINMPAMKERPMDSSKPPIRHPKPPKEGGIG